MQLKLRSERGASAVEFALVLPILALVVYGIIEMSIILYEVALLTNASREGARAGIVSQSPRVTHGDIDDVVQAYCENRFPKRWDNTYVPPGTTSFCTDANGISVPCANATFGTNLTVKVTYPYSFLLLPDFIIKVIDEDFDKVGGILLEAKTTMKME